MAVLVTRRRHGRVGLSILAAALLIAMLALTPATDAADGITIESDAGVILLSTGPDAGDNWIRYYESPSMPFNAAAYDEQQFIGLDRCKVTTPTGVSGEASLLTIAESPDKEDVGLVSNGFGIRASSMSPRVTSTAVTIPHWLSTSR